MKIQPFASSSSRLFSQSHQNYFCYLLPFTFSLRSVGSLVPRFLRTVPRGERTERGTERYGRGSSHYVSLTLPVPLRDRRERSGGGRGRSSPSLRGLFTPLPHHIRRVKRPSERQTGKTNGTGESKEG